MSPMAESHATVEDYIVSYPDDVRDILRRIRSTIRDAAPSSGEKISYQMPTVTMDDRAVFYYAAWKHHIGLYPIPPLDEPLQSRVAPLRAAKDSLHLPLKQPIPYDLISELTVALIERAPDS